jgi:hypothetical protein
MDDLWDKVSNASAALTPLLGPEFNVPKSLIAAGDATIAGLRMGVIREALSGEVAGNLTYPGGPITAQEANTLGRSFVGPNPVAMSGGKGLVSADGLRSYRFPTSKPYGGTVANMERRAKPDGRYTVNIHILIKP